MSFGSVLCRSMALGIAGLAGLAGDGMSTSNAKQHRNDGRHHQYRFTGTPRLAVIALAEQRVSIYGAAGKIAEAPVSTGAKGYETPAGIYSIVQKEEEHHSNLYDDASMPFMERLTWTGIAMHAGTLPGYPASHGCSRLPHAFAERLYRLTALGMRVVIVREDIAPAEIAQPFMFTSSAASKTSAAGEPAIKSVALDGSAAANGQAEAEIRARLQSLATARLAEAHTAINREQEARTAAAQKAAEALPWVRSLEAAEAKAAEAEADLQAAERSRETDVPERKKNWEAAEAQAAAKLEAARVQLETAKALARAKTDTAARAEEDAKAALAAMNRAIEAAEAAKQNTSPVSVFISRKTQRLYIRRGNEPVFEGPVIIRDAGKPAGTFVLTALNYTATPGLMRWNVVSMYKNAANIEPSTAVKSLPGKSSKSRAVPPADVAAAQAALARLQIPEEALSRISEVLLPGSSLIISDEGPSSETGKDTDFIVFMSGEPQGGIAMRKHASRPRQASDGNANRKHTSRHRDAGSEAPRRSKRQSHKNRGFFFFFEG